MQFQDELAGGVVLIRPALQSPDYVAGASGWAIKVDGSAEFNNITIRGSGTADPLVVGPAGAPQVIIRTTPTNGLIVFPTNRPIEQNAATLNSAVVNSGAADERAELQMTGPTVTGATSGVRLVLRSQPNNGSLPAEFSIQDRAGTTTYFAVDNTEVRVVERRIDSRQLAAAGVVLAGYVTTDAFDRIQILASGEIQWGSGAAARDVRLYRGAANVLQTDNTFEVLGELHPNNLVRGERALSTDSMYESRATGDAFARWFTRASGETWWGSGAATQDVRLYRSAASTLTVGGNFTVDGVGQVQYARRTSDLSRNASGPSDDPQLQFSVAANAVYALVGWVKYSALDGADISLDWSAPAGALGEWTGHGQGFATTAQTTNGYQIRTETTDITASRAFSGTTATTGEFSILIMGTLRTAGTAGTYALQWAQNTTDAANPTTVYTDSWLRLERIA